MNVIPQDIGRVLLNLINNAFQACTEPSGSAAAGVEKPLVQVSTRKSDNGIEIRVSDNGSRIPDDIKDKIFQPFFTTKPTGQGTGLGLSLSYDIVKAHGGELKVETKNNQVCLPARQAQNLPLNYPYKMTIRTTSSQFLGKIHFILPLLYLPPATAAQKMTEPAPHLSFRNPIPLQPIPKVVMP